MYKILIFTTLIGFFSTVFCQIPVGYYAAANEKSGYQLQVALSRIIDDHQIQTYPSLWLHFQQTDTHNDTLIWDIYTDNPSGTTSDYFQWGTDQCATGGSGEEFDCYSREHTFCQSWFGGGREAPYTDLFHIYPVDSYINTIRNNNAYGIVSSPTRVFSNGSKFGANSRAGAPTGNAFEPIDNYKGDIARSFFYMATRYMFEDSVFSTSQPMTYKSQLQDWALEMLMEWHLIDPVSEKERERNSAIYGIQQNRNPFIDHPELAGKIWGNDSLYPFIVDNPIIPERPKIANFEILDDQTLMVRYDKPVLEATAIRIENYTLAGANSITSAFLEENSVTLTLESSLVSGQRYNLIVRNIQGENLYFIADTSVSFIYGYPSNKKVIFAWTFDSLRGKPDVSGTINANITIGEMDAVLYLNGQYGSSDFENNSELDAFEGVLLGDPRVLDAEKGKSLSLQSNTANGKAITLKFSTLNFYDLSLSFACRRTNSGFTSHQWEWSLDGQNYFLISDTHTVPDEEALFELKTLNLSAISELQNSETLFLRLMVNGATSLFGNNRFDNIVIHGTPLTNVIAKEIRSRSFLLYPNPTKGTVTVQMVESLSEQQRYHIWLFDMQGNQVYYQQIKNGKGVLDLHALAKGSYLVEIRDGKGKIVGKEKIILS